MYIFLHVVIIMETDDIVYIKKCSLHSKNVTTLFMSENKKNLEKSRFSLNIPSSQYGNRTRVFAVRGRRLDPLTNWPCLNRLVQYTPVLRNMQALFFLYQNFFVLSKILKNIKKDLHFS